MKSITITEGDTYKAKIIFFAKDSLTRVSAVVEAADIVVSILDNDGEVFHSPLSYSRISTGIYQVLIDTTSLNMEKGVYYLQFTCKVNGNNTVKRFPIYVNFI
jgi:hypothetical protein